MERKLSMSKNIFTYKDYKKYLAETIKSYQPQHGAVTRMAQAAGCQRSYLSQVLNGSAHLVPDHIFGIARFLGLREVERDYLLLLLEKDRAATLNYREYVQTKIDRLRRENLRVKAAINAKIIETPNLEKLLSYYSSWVKMAVHTIVSIPQYQTPEAIANRLQLSVAQVNDCLNELKGLGFVTFKGGRWQYANGSSHISSESPLSALNHNNWRQRSATIFPQSSLNGGVHYTSVFSLSKDDFTELRSKILDWIQTSRQLIEPSPCEELVCLSMDCFAV